MKIVLTDNEGEELGEITQNYELHADLPLEAKEEIRSLMRSAKRFGMDIGPVERGGSDDGVEVTPGELVTDHDTETALARLKVAIDRMTPHHADLEETEDTAIKAVDGPWDVPEEKEVEEGAPGFHYYEVGKDAADGDVLEIRDHYRVWVRDEDEVPDDQEVRYDESGDEAGNHWYYDVPFDTATRIDLSACDVPPENVVEKDAEAELSPEEIERFGVTETDSDLLAEAAEAIEHGEPAWGEHYSVTDGVVKDVESPVTLLGLYKLFHDANEQYNGYLRPIQHELKDRGVQAVDKVARKRRTFGNADNDNDNLTLEKSGDLVRFERE